MPIADIMTADPVVIAEDEPLEEAMRLMDQHNIRHLPVVQATDKQHVLGILTEQILLEETGWLPRRIGELLGNQAGPVGKFMYGPIETVSADDPIERLSQQILARGMGCQVVLRDDQLVGVVTDIDVMSSYLDAMAAEDGGQSPALGDLMTCPPIVISRKVMVEDAAAVLTLKGIRHLPIVDGERLCGILSDRDLRHAAGSGGVEGEAVEEYMSTDPIHIGVDASLPDAVALMVNHKIGALPVIDAEQHPVGILTVSDVFSTCYDSLLKAATR